MKRHFIQLPKSEGIGLDQDEAYFYLIDSTGEKEKISFHDYDRIYQTQGLYEQIFYDRLRCTSPTVLADSLFKALQAESENFTELRVLDFGAGNGLMGESLKRYGVARLVGADISKAASAALFRDRPGLYDDYYVEDFTKLSKSSKKELIDWSFDCLTTVAALGFGDIPVKAFYEAVNLVRDNGWLVFNIKETFMKSSDQSGFSHFIRNLILSDCIGIFSIERYRHRVSIEGVPLYYYAIIAKKKDHIPSELLVSTR